MKRLLFNLLHRFAKSFTDEIFRPCAHSLAGKSQLPVLHLTVEEKTRLDSRRRWRSAPVRQVERAKILWHDHAGLNPTAIKATTTVSGGSPREVQYQLPMNRRIFLTRTSTALGGLVVTAGCATPSSSRSDSCDRPARDLVGYWPLRGNARDHSGHGNHSLAHGNGAADGKFE